MAYDRSYGVEALGALYRAKTAAFNGGYALMRGDDGSVDGLRSTIQGAGRVGLYGGAFGGLAGAVVTPGNWKSKAMGAVTGSGAGFGGGALLGGTLGANDAYQASKYMDMVRQQQKVASFRTKVADYDTNQSGEY